MNTTPRAKLDFGDDDDVVLPVVPTPAPPREQIEAVSKALGLRETPKKPEKPKQSATVQPVIPRRTRMKTNRVHVFATRVKLETLQEIHNYADDKGILLAEVIERAMEALREKEGKRR